MAKKYADRVMETSISTGAGDLALGGAVLGFQGFSSVLSVGDTCDYAVVSVDGNGVPTGGWETGLGTYSAANTLTRTTVQESSNGGAAVNFGVGTKRVFLSENAASIAAGGGGTGGTVPAEDSCVPALMNGYSNFESGYQELQAFKIGRTVIVTGVIAGPSNVVAFQMPAGWRPAAMLHGLNDNSGGAGSANTWSLAADGSYTPNGGTTYESVLVVYQVPESDGKYSSSGGGLARSGRYWLVNSMSSVSNSLALSKLEALDAGGNPIAISAITARTNYQNSYPASNMIDNDVTTLWANDGLSGMEWIKLDMGAAVEVHALRLTTRNDSGGATQTPMQLSLSVSADDTSYKFVGAASLPGVFAQATAYTFADLQ